MFDFNTIRKSIINKSKRIVAFAVMCAILATTFGSISGNAAVIYNQSNESLLLDGEKFLAASADSSDYIVGDVNADGNINMADVVAIRRFLVNPSTYPLKVKSAGDATGDGNINMADVVAIRRFLVNNGKYPLAEHTPVPSEKATTDPTAKPTTVPTAKPTTAPTAEPTTAPTAEPTTVPTAVSTVDPSATNNSWDKVIIPSISETLNAQEETVYQDDYSGAVFVDRSGDVELTLRRTATGPVAVYSYGLEIPLTSGQVALQFDFNYEKVGDYGVAIRVITDLTSGAVDWTFLNQIAIIADYNGKAALQVWNDTLTADANGRKLALAQEFEPDTNYTITFVMTVGSNQYDVVVNNIVCGTYTHFETPGAIYGLRFDQHGYTANTGADDNLVDEMYYDNFIVGTVGESNSNTFDGFSPEAWPEHSNALNVYDETTYSTIYDGSSNTMYWFNSTGGSSAYIAQRIDIVNPFDILSFGAGGSGTVDVELFSFNTNVTNSISGTPIASKTVTIHHSEWRTAFMTDSTLPAGTYVLKLSNPGNPGGCWIATSPYATGKAPATNEVVYDSNIAGVDFSANGIAFRTFIDKTSVDSAPTAAPTAAPTTAPSTDFNGLSAVNLGTNFTAQFTNVSTDLNLSLSDTNVIIYTKSTAAAQKYRFILQSDGSYMLVNTKNFYVLTAASASSGAAVTVALDTGVATQRWYIYNTANGYIIKSAASDNVLVPSGTASLSGVVTGAYTGDSLQCFTISEGTSYATAEQMEVLRYIIYAVETGGQVYGNADYTSLIGAGHNTSNEVAITIGAGQWYAGEAKRLLNTIRSMYPEVFAQYDADGALAADLDASDWSTYAIAADSAMADRIRAIIGTDGGKVCQDMLLDMQMEEYLGLAASKGVTEIKAMMMCANIRHQGGASAVTRILGEVETMFGGAYYTLDNIKAALDDDTGNQVGAYTSRQNFVYNTLKSKIG